VFIVSDKLENVKAELEMKIVDFNGDSLWSGIANVEISANSSQVYFELQIPELTKEDHLVSVRLILDGKVLASNTYYFLPVKDLQLPDPNINKEIVKTEEGYQITLKTDRLAKNVFLSVDRDGFFSDNYFDLLPGEEKRITFISKWVTDSFGKELKIISLVDTL